MNTGKTYGKIKKKQYKVISPYEWHDIIPAGAISVQIDKQHRIYTDQYSICLYLNGYYYGLELFKDNDIQQLKGWSLILPFNEETGIVANVNSIGDKCMSGVYSFS